MPGLSWTLLVLNPNFRDMLSALNDASVEYLVVGAYAMAAHGCPRSTGDIDFWVRPTPENARRVWQALIAFGAPTAEISVDDFSTSDIVYQIGIAPQRIDILTSVTGVDFDDAWSNRLTADLDGLSAHVIGRNELLQNKLASGRPKDLLDADILKNEER
jgi:hypothetical protein